MEIKFSRVLQRIRVIAGYIFAVIFLVFCQPNAKSILIGCSIGVIGLLIRGWATGHLRKERALDSSGPYAYTRNPLYLGSFVITVGFAIASGIWWLATLSIIFFLGIYLPVMNVEKGELKEALGVEYIEYAENVPAFIPRLTPWENPRRRFDFHLYLRNREYSAAVGFLLTALALIAKAYFLGLL